MCDLVLGMLPPLALQCSGYHDDLLEQYILSYHTLPFLVVAALTTYWHQCLLC